MDDYPEMTCPMCGHTEDDLDGFGMLACPVCGWCSHPSITGGVCDICRKKEGEE